MGESTQAEKRWYSTQDLEARYGISRYTVRLWERQGKLPKADRSRGRPRWWAPLVEDRDKTVGAASQGVAV